ncbi:MAG TPA: GYF domain-containing protein [Kofleriaceae bacterium]|nr:GYF domain-containing protein [Kofleriaceae bacterium]
MKFLCDRCKTRYSIGDDRVRGKILKIRCKNCNNVITVREGMPEIAADEPRRKGQNTQAIEAMPGAVSGPISGPVSSPVSGPVSTKPPAALEEEWYVSIDGEQSGPFSLSDAQRWITNKPFDADLHCWSEGFDDWLPVDKVSHFRGLRKKSVPTPVPGAPPPPLPRAGTGVQRAPSRPQTASDDEHKPLFSTTMASLEKSTQPPLGGGNLGLTPAPSSTRGTPLGGQPSLAKGNGAVKSPGASDSATQLEAEARTTPEPVASPAAKKSDPFAAKPDPFAPKADPFAPKADSSASHAAAKSELAHPVGDHDINDDLDIGEVSRVVKLADIVRAPRPSSVSAEPASRRSGAIAVARTGSVQSLGRTGSVPAVVRGGTQSVPSLGRTSGASTAVPTIGPDGKQIDPATGEPVPLAPQVAVSHRRGMIALLVGALVLLGAAGAAVIYMVAPNDDHASGGLVGYNIDTTRPDDPRLAGKPGAQPTPTTPQNPFVPRPTKPRPNPTNPGVGAGTPQLPTNPTLRDLGPEEVEEMAGKNSGATQTCWRRSQRGAEAIVLSDLKKLGVTLTVDKSGAVTNVALSDHAQTSLGKCISGEIRGWRFRESTAGITARITLVFQGV